MSGRETLSQACARWRLEAKLTKRIDPKVMRAAGRAWLLEQKTIVYQAWKRRGKPR
jgi:hypothetical protein